MEDHEILGAYDDESRGAQLRKIYENDGPHEELDEQQEFDDEKSSVDFEAELKNEIVTMVKEKIESIENKVRMFIDEHSVGCKKDFTSYD